MYSDCEPLCIWISLRKLILKLNELSVVCKSYRAVSSAVFPWRMSLCPSAVVSSLCLSAVVIQHKMENPGRPPRCHLPWSPFLMRHLLYTNRFQCLIKTIHFLSHASGRKYTISKLPFYTNTQLHTHQWPLSANWKLSQLGQSLSSIAGSSLLLSLLPVFSLSVPKVSRLAWNTRYDIRGHPGGCWGPSSCIDCTSAISMHALTKWAMLCHVMSCCGVKLLCHVTLCSCQWISESEKGCALSSAVCSACM